MSSRTSRHGVHRHCLNRYWMVLRVFEVAYPISVWSYLLLSQNLSPNPNPNVFPANKNRSFHLENTSKLIHFSQLGNRSLIKFVHLKKAIHVRLLKFKFLPQDSSTKQGKKTHLRKFHIQRGKLLTLMTWTERSEKTLEIWSEIDKPTIWFEKEGGKTTWTRLSNKKKVKLKFYDRKK